MQINLKLQATLVNVCTYTPLRLAINRQYAVRSKQQALTVQVNLNGPAVTCTPHDNAQSA